MKHCEKFHKNQLINIGVVIKDGRQMDSIFLFFGLSVIPRLIDGWSYWDETYWDGREHMQNNLAKEFFFNFEIQDRCQMDYIVKKEFLVFFCLSVVYRLRDGCAYRAETW